MIAFLGRQRWWLGRIAVLPLHMLGFALVVFVLVRLIPGDPVAQLLGGQNASPEMIESARASLGLSGSIVEQLRDYLGNLVTLDFGRSMLTGVPVWQEMTRRLFETIEIAVLAMVGSTALTLVAGFMVVLRPKNPISRLLVPYARTAGAIPDFVLGVAGIFVFYTVLHVLPAPVGRYDPLLNAPPKITGFPILDTLLTGDTTLLVSMANHLALPLVVLVLAYTPLLLKLFIRALEDAVDAPPTRFRIASGASRRALMLSITRRAAPAAVAMLGTLFGFMLGGAVVVEQLFSMPGMGQFGVQAVNTSDRVSLQGFLLLVAAVSLVVFLLVDIVNMLLDPRRRPGRASRGAT
jgi:ABC-type dipeptide/oligopeptide/nickel transport system permease component